MTKREMFEKIMSVNANDVEIVKFCNHEIELLDKKKDKHTPSETQIENEKIKHEILEILVEADRPLTITEIMKDGRVAGLTNQKVSGLVTRLKIDGLVERTVVKRKAFFKVKEQRKGGFPPFSPTLKKR